MAIVNITRLQVRRGDFADLPQLSSAELGWAVDTQQLFIGNGSLAEGAPYVGNTEILTEHSSIFTNLLNADYDFKGNGPVDITTGVTRPLQDRLDDYVSIHAWGEVGLGDDAVLINQALSDLYINSDQTNKIGLYLPAGIYSVSTPIEIPPNAYIFGDGIGNTVIQSGYGPIIKTVDSLGQSGISMGNGLGVGETLPTNITLRGLTLNGTVDAITFTEIQSTTNMVFDHVEFLGIYDDITGVTNSDQVGLTFVGTNSITACGNITLSHCRFKQIGRAFQPQGLLYGISFNQCLFDTCYFAINLDYDPTLLPDVMDPVIVQNSYFHNISRYAIFAAEGSSFTSMGNRYVNVGNEGTGSPTGSVLESNNPGCVSWMDRFDRPADDVVQRFVVATNGANTAAYADPEDRMRWGLRETLRTYKVTLTGGSSGSLNDIAFRPGAGVNGNTPFQEIRYAIKRDGDSRAGIIIVAGTATDANIQDTYTYAGATDTGVVFTASVAAGIVTVNYSISAGNSATLILSPTNLIDE